MELTEEQIQTIQNVADELIEIFKKIYDAITPIICEIWYKTKELLNRKISLKKRIKKGKRYILRLKKIELYKLLVEYKK